jgi:hypothetical protein
MHQVFEITIPDEKMTTHCVIGQYCKCKCVQSKKRDDSFNKSCKHRGAWCLHASLLFREVTNKAHICSGVARPQAALALARGVARNAGLTVATLVYCSIL